MKVGNRLVCDKCGRIESPKLKVQPNPTDSSRHLCDECRKVAYSQNFPSIQNEN
ncbi:MAG: hypothetical protein ACW964_18245 [Candidatus Hodarchaeales archaeon]